MPLWHFRRPTAVAGLSRSEVESWGVLGTLCGLNFCRRVVQKTTFFHLDLRIEFIYCFCFGWWISIRAAMQKKTFVQIFQRWRNISLFSGIARIGVINDTGLLGLQAELCQEGQMAYSIVTQMQCERWWYLPRRDVVCKHTYDSWPILALMLQCNFPSRYFQASPYTFILHTCSCLSKTQHRYIYICSQLRENVEPVYAHVLDNVQT